MLKTFILTAVSAGALVIAQPQTAQAGDPYVGFDILTGWTQDDFGGFNTIGPHSNTDEEDNWKYGVAFVLGLRDQWDIGSTTLTPEFELAAFDDYSARTASFPGLPAPTFFYNSSIQTWRVGANLWVPVSQGDDWRAEAGLGLGAVFRDIRANDGVVAGAGDDTAAYGQIGLRYLKSVSDRGSMKLGASYVVTDETDINLVTIVGGAPAGNYSVQTNSLELRFGYELKLN